MPAFQSALESIRTRSRALPETALNRPSQSLRITRQCAADAPQQSMPLEKIFCRSAPSLRLSARAISLTDLPVFGLALSSRFTNPKSALVHGRRTLFLAFLANIAHSPLLTLG